MTTLQGLITHFEITPACIDNREALRDLTTQMKHRILLTDKGYISDTIMSILIQNTLFGFEGISVQELSNICEYSESIIRNTLKILETQQLLLISKDGRKLLYDLDLEKL